MQEKEVNNPVITSNFEINKKNNAVVLYINPKIFPVSLITNTASLFRENAWVAVDSNEDEVLVELKPKHSTDLELLAREFNNELLNLSTNDVKVDNKSNALLSRIKDVVAEFIREEQGRISKQSVLVIGSLLATLGFAEIVNASHLCPIAESGSEGTDASTCETGLESSCG